jgi:hypothetical protein
MNSKNDISSIQKNILLNLIKKNSNTAYAKDFNFNKIKTIEDFQKYVPINEYESFKPYINRIMSGETQVLTQQSIHFLVPSSGTSSSTKYIPYTKDLQNDFSKALYTWLYDLYLNFPSIKKGKSLWIISPKTQIQNPDSSVPIGFPADSSYFGKMGKIFINSVMLLPEDFNQIQSRTNYYYLLALFMLKEEKLRMISVWNPSILPIVLDTIIQHKESLINAISGMEYALPKDLGASKRIFLKHLKPSLKRADSLKKLLKDSKENTDWSLVWPNLMLVSAWADAWAKLPFLKIEKLFAKAYCQPKGLLMTEGVVTIPIYNKNKKASENILMHHTHFFEFKNLENDKTFLINKLETATSYELIITNTSGLYRYNTHDIVKFIGIRNKKVILKFEGKNDIISDITGEKLHINLVEKTLKKLIKIDIFYFLSPIIEKEKVQYILFIEKSNKLNIKEEKILLSLDQSLQENYYYKNARDLGQIKLPKILWMDKSMINLYHRLVFKHKNLNTIKTLILKTDPEWTALFVNQLKEYE